MGRESTAPESDRSRIELLHELVEASLELWDVKAIVMLDESGLWVHAGRRILSVRCDARSTIAPWWVTQMTAGATEVASERPRTSSLGVLKDLRRFLATMDH